MPPNNVTLIKMIRHATHDDIDQMLDIGLSVTIDTSRLDEPAYTSEVRIRGFLPEGFATRKIFREEIDEGVVSIVYEESNSILGFCTIKNEIYFPESAEEVIWIDEKAKATYYHSNTSTVVTYLIIEPKSVRKGFGSTLFDESIKHAREKGFNEFFGITSLSPLANLASMSFLAKKGFSRACFTRPADRIGFKNQQGVLYWKQYE